MEKCKFLLQNSLFIDRLVWDPPIQSFGAHSGLYPRIWPVTALHPMLKCHSSTSSSKSHSLWRFLPWADLLVAATVAPLELVSVNVHVVARARHQAAGGF